MTPARPAAPAPGHSRWVVVLAGGVGSRLWPLSTVPSVAGAPSGRVRRPTLFVIAAIGTIVGTQHLLGAVVALIAIVLLAVTDSVVEL